MKHILSIIIVTFYLNAFECRGQEYYDHLEPVGGIFDIYDFQFEYYSKVRNVLFKGLSDSPEIQFLIMPSFTPENVLSIEFNREKNEYYLVYHICENMIWYNKKWKNIKVKKYRRKIEKESADLVKSLFKIAVYNAKYPKKDFMGLDGVNYYFTVRDYGQKAATIWSPPKDSKTDRLINVGFDLISLAKEGDVILSFDKEMIEKIENLKNDLNNSEN